MRQTSVLPAGRDPINNLIDRRTQRIESYSYKLADGPNRYGLDVAICGDTDIDESRMSVVIPFADGNRRDGVGDILEVSGIDTSRHVLNPIVLFDHGKHVQLPIALAQDRDTNAYTVEVDPIQRCAKANAFFYQGTGGIGADFAHALFCEQIFDLMVKRFIRAGSIGYQVVYAKNLQPDFERGTPAGLHLIQVLMLELSAVVLPANGDTVRKMLAMPQVCGKPLSPYLVKSLSPYAPPKRAQMGYEPRTDLKAIRLQYRASAEVKGHTPEKSKRKADVDNRDSYLSTCPRDASGHCKPRGTDDETGAAKKPANRAAKKPEEHKPAKVKDKKRKVRKVKPIKKKPAPEKDQEKDEGKKNDQKKTRRQKIREELKKKTESKSTGANLMAKEINHKTKALNEPPPDDDLEEVDDTADDLDDGGNAYGDEPFGAQVLRRLHEDHSILMEDYHQMVQVLDHPKVKKLVLKQLESIDAELTQFEEMLAAEYPDLPGIGGSDEEGDMEGEDDLGGEEEVVDELPDEGGEDESPDLDDDKDMDTMDDTPVPASSGDPNEEDPDPEEAVEGMRRKRLSAKEIKSIRGRYRKKGMCQGCSKEPCVCKKQKNPAAVAAVARAAPMVAGAVGDLLDDEKAMVGEAGGFLGELSQTQEWGEEHRMKSYHYHKTLEGIAQVEKQAEEGEKAQPGTEEWEQEEGQEPEHQEKMCGPRKMIGEASSFLGELSRTQQLEDGHRQRASELHKSLTEIVGEGSEGGPEEDEGPERGFEPGEMDTKRLASVYEKQSQEIEALNKRLASLSWVR